MYEIMLILYEHGFTEIHVGGLMRLFGVDNQRASEHDDEVVVLDQQFAKYVRFDRRFGVR
jgi:hypothetical protein